MTPSFRRPRRWRAAAARIHHADFRPHRLEPRTLLADAGTLLADINPTTDMLDPRNLLSVGAVAYFAGRSAAGDGSELFRTDGTPGGTVRVKDINLGLPGSDPQRFAAAGRTVFFVATDTAAGQELWKTDGTEAGTVRVKDIRPGPANSAPNNLTVVGDTLFFSADDGTSGVELWNSDGTEAGTVRVRDIVPGSGGSSPAFLVNFNGALLFAAGSGSGRNLWRSDGTTAGTAIVAPIASGENANVRNLMVMGDAVYFSADPGGFGTSRRGDLYRTDGTAAGTRRVKAINFGTSDDTGLAAFAASGDLLYFLAGEVNRADYELWRSDGTEAGTFSLLANDSFAPLQTRFTPVGERSVVFALETPDAGTELWASDGTAGGTGMITELAPGPADGVFTVLGGVRMGDAVYFSPNVDLSRPQLWRTDGTSAGTALVADVPDAGQFLSLLGTMGAANDVLLFSGARFVGDGDLYRSDGTPEGTRRVGAASPPVGNNSSMSDLTALSDQSPAFFRAGPWVYFEANDGVHGDELWRVAANAPAGATPEMVADLAPGGASSDPATFTLADDGALYFTAVTPGRGREPFRLAPGAGQAPQPLPEALPGPESSVPWRLSAVGNLLYFSAREALGETAVLWRYDPATGALAKATLSTGQALRGPTALARFGDSWYFGADAFNGMGHELYRTDGTNAGTRHVRDIATGGDSSLPGLFTPLGDTLYFITQNPLYELWKTDGTQSGTVRVADFAPNGAEDTLTGLVALDGFVYVSRSDDRPEGRGIWRSDGTPGGTVRIAAIQSPSRLLVVGERLFVLGLDDAGAAVFSVDPVTGATARVTEPQSAGGFQPANLFAAGGDVYATGFGYTGTTRDRVELWEIDGGATSPAGATRLRVVSPWVSGSMLGGYWTLGRYALGADDEFLYFPAYSTERGIEPHRVALDDVPPVPPPRLVSGRHVFYNNSGFDGGSGTLGAADDGAIATDKRALLPEQAASYANMTNYSRGINGIMIDLSGGMTVETLEAIASSIAFHTSPGDAGAGASWADAPRPSAVDIRPRAGVGGADRIAFAWPDNAIKNAWLRVTVQAPPEIGLFRDVFVFGNLSGETGDPGGPTRINALDLAAVKRALATTAGIASNVDVNHDGRVNALDLAAVRANLTRTLGLPPAIPVAPVSEPLAVRRMRDELLS